jgi:dienelactone hydrolase
MDDNPRWAVCCLSQRPSINRLENFIMQIWPMRPLLWDDQEQPIRDAESWQKRAATIRQTFVSTLGEAPDSQRLHSYELVERVESEGVARTLMRITVDDDDVMEAFLMEPADPAKRKPGAVALALHQTNNEGKNEVAGIAGSAKLRYALELAQRGWTVLAPDQFAITRRYGKDIGPFETGRFYDRFPKWSAVGKSVSDSQIALDVMEQLPQTKGHRPSVIGHSLGGHGSVFLAAVDDRISQVVSNCGVYPFADSFAREQWFRDRWYIYFKDQAFKKSVVQGPVPLWDFHELCALVAPRRLCLLSASNDALVRSAWGLHQMGEQLHRLYALLQTNGALLTVTHNEEHSFSNANRAMAYAWMEAGLKEGV